MIEGSGSVSLANGSGSKRQKTDPTDPDPQHWYNLTQWDRMLHRELNNLWRARLSCDRKKRPHAHPLLLSVSWTDRRHTRRLRKRDNLLTGRVEPNQRTARKLGPLQIIQSSLVYFKSRKVLFTEGSFMSQIPK